jgi:hypothetical protein
VLVLLNCAHVRVAEPVTVPTVAVTTQSPASHAYELAVASPVVDVYEVADVDFSAQPVPVMVHVTSFPTIAFPAASATVAVTVPPVAADGPAAPAAMSIGVFVRALTPAVVFPPVNLTVPAAVFA